MTVPSVHEREARAESASGGSESGPDATGPNGSRIVAAGRSSGARGVELRGPARSGRVLRAHSIAGGEGRAAGNRSPDLSGALDLCNCRWGWISARDRASVPIPPGLSVDLRRCEREPSLVVGLP